MWQRSHFFHQNFKKVRKSIPYVFIRGMVLSPSPHSMSHSHASSSISSFFSDSFAGKLQKCFLQSLSLSLLFQMFTCAHADNLSVINDSYPVSNFIRFFHIMRSQKNRHIFFLI